MRKYWILCICIGALLGLCSAPALAESTYEILCSKEEVNREHVAAWIEIAEASFCQPIMRHPENDAFYSSHGPAGEESELGAIYLQAGYNQGNFADPVTVVYGGSKKEGAPFRELQELYSGRFEDCRSILLHLPEETLEYRVFAAVPYSSIHILHYYDFTVRHRFEGFFNAVYSTRALGMHLADDEKPMYEERVLILSTGMRGDQMQRYLVMAKLVEDEEE